MPDDLRPAGVRVIVGEREVWVGTRARRGHTGWGGDAGAEVGAWFGVEAGVGGEAGARLGVGPGVGSGVVAEVGVEAGVGLGVYRGVGSGVGVVIGRAPSRAGRRSMR
ncbi:hypothetical protein [Nonomuraea dietziae]|uniref:hypothetical protein n=1 Tax=Nonomuraea dietziae TaxID=65515 RepID=UPI0031D2776A